MLTPEQIHEHPIFKVLYGYRGEDLSHQDLVDRLTGNAHPDIRPIIRSLVRNFEIRGDYDLAGEILGNGKSRIISMFIGGSVGGLVFQPYHPDSVREVVAIKSRGGVNRQELFSMVADRQSIDTLVDWKRAGRTDLSAFEQKCFVQLPLADGMTNLIPPQFYKESPANGVHYLQVFLLPHDSPLGELIAGTTGENAVQFLGGTSSNYSSWGSLVDRYSTAMFAVASGIHFFDTPSVSGTNPGSFPIVRMDESEMIQIRAGNRPVEDFI